MVNGVDILIILFIMVLIIILVYESHKSQYEHFNADSLKPDYVNTVYHDKGIEACRALSASNYMATNFIDSLRMRVWKPLSTDQHYKEYLEAKSNSEFCYYFMDNDKRILKTNEFPNGYSPITDPLANAASCKKENPVFKDHDFITNVFESTGYDSTHNLPYKKCVMQINKEQATPEVVESFWKSFVGDNNKAFCEGMANTIQAEIKAYIDKIKELTHMIIPFRKKYVSTDKLKEGLDKCIDHNKALVENLKHETAVLKTLQTNIQKSNEEYAQKISEVRKQLGLLNEQIGIRESDLVQLKNNYQYVLTVNLQELKDNINEFTKRRDACYVDLSSITQQYEKVAKEHQNVTANYRMLSLKLANCEKQTRDILAMLEEKKPQLLDYQEKLANVRTQLLTCQTEQARLLTEQEYWKENLQQVTSDYNKCLKAKAALEAEIASFKVQKDMLIREIEEIKRRCRDDQSQFNLATVEIHKEASKEIINTEQQRCSASIAMRKRRIELLNEINGILLQANNCDRIVASCKCYKRVHEFAWNDEGTTNTRAWTTSGRIVEIRKYLQAAPYIQFTSANGEKSAMLRLTKTRKKKGGGSYVDVAGPITIRRLRSAALFAQQS